MSTIDGIEKLAVGEWSRELAGLTGEAIRAGLDAWDGDWPPSAPEFARLCRDVAYGVPTPGDAWRLICNARGKPGTLPERYHHPVVLAAAMDADCDVFGWSQLSEREGLSRFTPLYQRLLDKLAAGTPFDWPEEYAAVEDKSGRAVTPEEKAQAVYRRKKEIRKAKAMVRGKMNVVDDWQKVHGMRAYV